jgi:uncharacterized protein YfeS
MNFKPVFITLTIIVFVMSCTKKESASTTSNQATDEWPAMDSFHMTMAEAFHPLKDSGNVEPAMRLMGRLADEAEKWASAPLPEKVNNDDVKAKLEKLKTDLRDLSDDVNDGAPEDQIGTGLFTIHDQFHEIMEAWHGGGEKQDH